MKTKALILDVRDVAKKRDVGIYGDHRIYVFDEKSHSVIKNYLSSYGIHCEDYWNNMQIGRIKCDIIAEQGLNAECIANLPVILDSYILFKIEKNDYKNGTGYSSWLESHSHIINEFLED